MNIEEKKQLRDELRALAISATEPNSAKGYAAFGINKGNKFRIAVSVGKDGAYFRTENQALLASLADRGITFIPFDEGKPRSKKKYMFPDLTISQIRQNEPEFRTLVCDSIAHVEGGY